MNTEERREHEESPPASAASATDLAAAHDLEPLPLDLVSPQFTLRALLTGMVLAAVFSACNIYIGLLIGWSLNMSITAALLSYGLWMGLHGLSGGRVRKWGILENNINQTACSSGASVSSAGLVAPIPALAMLTGTTLTWHYLALWVFSVTLVGITVAIALRRQMLLVDKLPFPMGIASAETLREMYARGAEAVARVKMLATGGVVASALTLIMSNSAGLFGVAIRHIGLPLSIKGFTAKALTFAIEPKLLMVGIGGMIGFRACASLLLGAIVAYGVLAPSLTHSGHIRLTIREPLPALPTGVTLPPAPEGYAKYHEDRHQLEWKGVMTAAEQDGLLALSDEPRYQEAVCKLYVRSQLDLSVPPGEPLPTTRELQISEPLAEFPRDLVIPRQYDDLVRYDQRRARLVAIGPLSIECRDELLRRADELQEDGAGQAPALVAFRQAVNNLHGRSGDSFLPAGVTIPESLTQVVTYDDATKTWRARGVLNDDQTTALRDLSQDADYQAAVARLIGGTRLVPAGTNYSQNYIDMIQWLLWPGVTLMVVSSLVSFAFSWRSIIAVVPRFGSNQRQTGQPAVRPPRQTGEVTRRWFLGALVVALILSVALQVSFFAILWWAAVVGVLLSFVLAIVAARVSGETGITPIGAMGKVTQLVFGALVPKSPAANLMAANVTGGAASQCADLLHDLKCGYLLGASPKLQALAQVCGALAGALVGSAVYLILIPNPAEQLITPEWPAPAVAAWKLVAELFQIGWQAMPPGAASAMAIAGAVAVILPVLEKVLPGRARLFVPSCASLGLGFVIPGWNSISMFIGGLIALCLGKWCRSWSKRFLIAICAGIVAGESLTGVGMALWRILT